MASRQRSRSLCYNIPHCMPMVSMLLWECQLEVLLITCVSLWPRVGNPEVSAASRRLSRIRLPYHLRLPGGGDAFHGDVGLAIITTVPYGRPAIAHSRSIHTHDHPPFTRSSVCDVYDVLRNISCKYHMNILKLCSEVAAIFPPTSIPNITTPCKIEISRKFANHSQIAAQSLDKRFRDHVIYTKERFILHRIARNSCGDLHSLVIPGYCGAEGQPHGER